MLTNIFSQLKKIKSRLKKRDFLITFALPFLVMILFVITVIFTWFQSSVRSQICSNIVQSVQQRTDAAADNLTHLLEHLTLQASSMYNIPEFRPLAFKADHYQARKMMDNFGYHSSKYDDVALVYPDDEWMLCSAGVCKKETFFTYRNKEQLIQTILSQQNRTLLNTMDYGDPIGKESLFYVQPLPIASARPRFSVIYKLHRNTISKLLYLDSSLNTGVTLLLIDQNRKCVWSNREEGYVSTNIPDISEVESGSLIHVQGNEYIFSFSPIGTNLVTLVSLESGDIISDNSTMNTAISMMYLCILLIVLFGIYVFYFSLSRCYEPIKLMISSYRSQFSDHIDGKTELEILSLFSHQRYDEVYRDAGSMAISKTHLQSLFVLSTIKGHYSSEEELFHLQANLDIHFIHPYFFVCSILFDNPLSQTEYQNLLVELQSEENEPLTAAYFSLLADTQTLVGIFNASDSSKETQLAILSHLHTRSPKLQYTSIAVGRCYSSLSEMGKSYFESRAAMDYRLVKGKNTQLFYDELLHEELDSQEYPVSLLHSYQHAVHAWDEAEIRKSLTPICDFITQQKISLHTGKSICYELMSRFLSEVRELEIGSPNQMDSICDIVSIVEFDSFNELIDKINIFSQKICEYVNRMKSSQDHIFLQNCIEFMEHNITNTQFSLELLADHFGISMQTLRTRFKQLTGKTPVAVMSQLRIERARLLLETTNQDISRIMEEVGYADASSFSRLFKKETGMTPTEYRNCHKQM